MALLIRRGDDAGNARDHQAYKYLWPEPSVLSGHWFGGAYMAKPDVLLYEVLAE
jgi:hypothetical protein